MNNDFPFQVTSTRTAYETPFIRIKEDVIVRKNGHEGIYSTVLSGDSVIIVAVDDQSRICFEEVYRHPVGKWQLEMPGGMTDDEDPVVAGLRELREETGIEAGRCEVIGRTLGCSGRSNEYQITVVARDLVIHELVEPEDEVRNIRFYTADEIQNLITTGAMNDSGSIVGLHLYQSWLSRQRTL